MGKKAFILAAFVLGCCHAAFAQRITESLQYWTLGVNAPEIQSGLRGDGTTGGYHHLLVGTSAYYYEAWNGSEAMVEFWVYDPIKCQMTSDPGYGSYGMAWGLLNPLYQAMAVGDFRQSFLAGCLGYSPWSTAVPYSPVWFKDGVRGANGVPWAAGWHKWTVDGGYEDITFTLHDVTYCITDGPPDDDTTTGDCIQTYDATSYGGLWAALFGHGWNAFWLRGDNPSGIEDPYIDVVGGAGDPCPYMQIISRPDTNAYVNVLYSYKVGYGMICKAAPTQADGILCGKAAATQSNGISYFILSGPQGMAIDSTGLLTFLPTSRDTGRYTITVKTSVDSGNYCAGTAAIQTFNLNVLPGQHVAGPRSDVIEDFDFSIEPNPAAAPVTFAFSSLVPTDMEVALYDRKGMYVKSYCRKIPAGEGWMLWDGRDEQGRQLPAGICFVKAAAGGRCVIKKMMYSPGE